MGYHHCCILIGWATSSFCSWFNITGPRGCPCYVPILMCWHSKLASGWHQSWRSNAEKHEKKRLMPNTFRWYAWIIFCRLFKKKRKKAGTPTSVTSCPQFGDEYISSELQLAVFLKLGDLPVSLLNHKLREPGIWFFKNLYSCYLLLLKNQVCNLSLPSLKIME